MEIFLCFFISQVSRFFIFLGLLFPSRLKCFFVSVLILFNLWMDLSFFVGFFWWKNVFDRLNLSLSCLLRKQIINLVEAFIHVYLVLL